MIDQDQEVKNIEKVTLKVNNPEDVNISNIKKIVEMKITNFSIIMERNLILKIILNMKI